MSSSERMEFVDAIFSELRSRLEHCVPDLDDRQHCKRLCEDLRVQYKGTMDAWTENLEYAATLRRRLKARDSRIESLEEQIAGLLGYRRGA